MNKGVKPFWDWIVDIWKGMDWAALWSASIDNLANIGTWIWQKGVKPFWDWIVDIWKGMDWSALWSASIDNLANIGTWIWNKGVKPFWTWISDIWKGMDWRIPQRTRFGPAAYKGEIPNLGFGQFSEQNVAVSYTHLTLPTILLV